MSELHVVLTDEERTFLVEYLEAALKNTLVEEHRTKTLSYRELVHHREDLIDHLLDKLRQTAQ
jgi:hypothetical protein